jgi:hypothetical protein
VRRAVIFIGGSREFAAVFQRTVASNHRELARAAILVPKAGRRSTPVNGVSHQRLGAPGTAEWAALRAELSESDADAALLMVPALQKLSRQPTWLRATLSKLEKLADEVVVVTVVADQLTLINDYYLNHIATWRTSGQLAKVGLQLVDNDAFVHERALRPWYQADEVRFVAVPAPEFSAGNPLEVVLRAAGVNPGDALVDADELPPRLGSVGVEANRLVATYLRAEIPDFSPDAGPVATASRVALTRAARLGWCNDEFWGWTARAADKALARFDASNRRFAATVWQGEWAIPYPVDRPCTQVDFLDLDPPTVELIHDYVVSTTGRVMAKMVTDR